MSRRAEQSKQESQGEKLAARLHREPGKPACASHFRLHKPLSATADDFFFFFSARNKWRVFAVASRSLLASQPAKWTAGRPTVVSIASGRAQSVLRKLMTFSGKKLINLRPKAAVAHNGGRLALASQLGERASGVAGEQRRRQRERSPALQLRSSR